MSTDELAPDTLTTPAEAAPEIAPKVAEAGGFEMSAHALATQLVAKLCHDFISPAGAIISGLDLLEDPTAQDMKQEAMNLISTSAKKMVTLVHFARVAFGAATSSEAFNASQLKTILADVFSGIRAELVFDIAPDTLFSKPAARALLNLGLIAGNALPVGGTATLTMSRDEDGLTLTSESKGPRARLKGEAIEGLTGLPLGEGLSGQWIQPHWLYSVVHEAGGKLDFAAEADSLSITLHMPE